MTKVDFSLYLDRLMQRIRDILVSKGAEYQQGNDNVFHNFEVSGRFLDCSPEKALFGYLAKHLISIKDIVAMVEHRSTGYESLVRRIEEDKRLIGMADEKIIDAIAYLLILHAMVDSRRPCVCNGDNSRGSI